MRAIDQARMDARRLQDRIDAAGARSVAAMRAWRLDRGLDNPKSINPVPDAAVTAEYFAARDAYRAALTAAGFRPEPEMHDERQEF